MTLSPSSVEALLRLSSKAARYDWVLPIVTGDTDDIATRRTMTLGRGLMRGLTGDALIAWAMEQPQ